MKRSLLVGLGNIGKSYEYTRHNLGFLIVEDFVKINQGSTFKKKNDLKVLFSEVVIGDNTIFVVKPITYMNFSGLAVKAVCKYFDIHQEDILVSVDDKHLPFGFLRLKLKGSSGGHKGLENINFFLKSSDYPRLRVGIGENLENKNLSEYVLSIFPKDELEMLPFILNKTSKVLYSWYTLSKEEVFELIKGINQ